MGYKLNGRVIMMGYMYEYMSCYVTVIHLLNVLELRGQVSKKIVCHHGLGFCANATYTLWIYETY